MKRLSALHLAGNALLLWLGYYWLGVGESRATSLLWSALIAVVLVTLTCWLHGATFAYFVGQGADLPKSFRVALRNLLAILAAVAVLLVIYGLLSWWATYSTQPAFNISSWLTLKLRKPVKPNSVFRWFQVGTWILRWVLVPVVVLPWLASISSAGWSGFRRRLPTRRWYWIAAPVLLVCSLWLPFVLLGWVPYAGKFPVEMVSFVVRLLMAYLLFVGAWLTLAFLTSGGKPAWSHASTDVKP